MVNNFLSQSDLLEFGDQIQKEIIVPKREVTLERKQYRCNERLNPSIDISVN